MRLLEYRQDLFGRGYTVVSSGNHYEAMRERECLPIRMRQLSIRGEASDCFENLVENLRFNYDLSKGTEEEHREKYANILLGKSPEWIIVAFQVTVGAVYLDIYNTKTEDISFCYLEADEYGFDLRFEVPRVDGGPCAIYDVSIEEIESAKKDARTTVTENINNVRREIEFFRKAPDSDEIYIEVTEYADL